MKSPLLAALIFAAGAHAQENCKPSAPRPEEPEVQIESFQFPQAEKQSIQAMSETDRRMYTLDENSVHILPAPSGRGGRGTIPQAGIIPSGSDFVNIGRFVWSLVKDNQPQADECSEYATALPIRAEDWRKMDGWQPTKTEIYQITAKNLLGQQVVDITYAVRLTYGGRYKGKGHYLVAAIIPMRVEPHSGFHASVSAEVNKASIHNYGTIADPIAGLTAEVHWTILSWLKETKNTEIFDFDGNGKIDHTIDPTATAEQKQLQKSNRAMLAMFGHPRS